MLGGKFQRTPFFSSIKAIVFPPVLIFAANGLLIVFLGINVLDENRIDKLFHIAGGSCASTSMAGIFWRLAQRKTLELGDGGVFLLLVFGALCFIVIGWELLEYVLFPYTQVNPYSDTITDMVCGLIRRTRSYSGYLEVYLVEGSYLRLDKEHG